MKKQIFVPVIGSGEQDIPVKSSIGIDTSMTWATKKAPDDAGIGQFWFSDIREIYYSDGVSWNKIAGTGSGNVINVIDYGASLNGITNDTSAFESAVDEAISSGIFDVVIPFGNMLIATASNLNLGGINLIFQNDSKMTVSSSASTVFLIGDGFSLADNWNIELTNEYASANADIQTLFATTGFSFTIPVNRRTNITIGRGTCTCLVSNTTGAVRGGRFFRGYIASTKIEGVDIYNMRVFIHNFGDDVSNISINNCRMYNIERGIVISGRDSEVGYPLISFNYTFINNQLINTSTQKTNYYSIPGSDMYNLLNLGNVTIMGGSCSYPVERCVYQISNENFILNGITVVGATLIKCTGMQYDLTSSGGLNVDRKAKYITIVNNVVSEMEADSYGIVLNFVTNVNVSNNQFTNSVSTAHCAVYVESYASDVRIENNTANNLKRGMIWFHTFKDLPASGAIALRPWGKYTAGYNNFIIQNNSGQNVCTLGADSSYTPARQIAFIYTLEEDDLTVNLIAEQRNNLYKSWVIKNNKVNVMNAFSGSRIYASGATTKGLIFINYCFRMFIEDNELFYCGGLQIIGIKVGVYSREIIVKHRLPQITDYSATPTVQSPCWMTHGSEIYITDVQLFDSNTYVTYEYKLTPIVKSGAFSPTTAREQAQDLALAYRLDIKTVARLESGDTIYLSSPTSGATRDYLTGVLDATLCSFAHVFGRIDLDNGEYANFYLNSPWTTPVLKSNSAGFAAAVTLETVTTTVTKALRLVNLSGALRRVEANHTFIVERASVL